MNNTLFDPFYSSTRSADWGHGTGEGYETCRLVTDNVSGEVANLANQFADGVPGWLGVLLTIPNFVRREWVAPNRLEIIRQLLSETLPKFCRCSVFFLPDQRLLLVLHADSAAQLAPIVRQLGALLLPEDSKESLRHVLFDLGRKDESFIGLCRQVGQEAAPQAGEPTSVLPARSTLTPAQLTTFQLTDVQVAKRAARAELEILVVEDDPATAALLVQLMNQKYHVASALDAVTAVREYRSAVPDLVLLDIGLPDVNGLELLQKMIAGDPQACVVMLTANAFKANLDAALQAGAKGFMAKPFNRDRLNLYLDMAAKLKNERRKG